MRVLTEVGERVWVYASWQYKIFVGFLSWYATVVREIDGVGLNDATFNMCT